MKVGFELYKQPTVMANFPQLSISSALRLLSPHTKLSDERDWGRGGGGGVGRGIRNGPECRFLHKIQDVAATGTRCVFVPTDESFT